MKRFGPIFWLVIVILLSIWLLNRLEAWQERQLLIQGEHIPGATVEVMLVGYEEENYPGKGEEEYERVGCNDVLVPVTIPASSPRLASVLLALSRMNPSSGELHNPMNEKGLVVESVEKRDGVLQVSLVGDPQFGGLCDTPRVKGQIEETIKLHTDEEFVMLLNGDEKEYRCMGEGRGCK